MPTAITSGPWRAARPRGRPAQPGTALADEPGEAKDSPPARTRHEHLERAIPTELRGRGGVIEDPGLIRQVCPEHESAAVGPRLDADKVRVSQVGGNTGRVSVAHDHDAPVHAFRMRLALRHQSIATLGATPVSLDPSHRQAADLGWLSLSGKAL